LLDGFCRIPISRFYRDRGVFDHIARKILPDLAASAAARGEREIRCWCAGCASGEEAYTLVMLWRHRPRARPSDPPLRIVATDVDERVLERARAAGYAASSLKELPRSWIETDFTARGDDYALRHELRAGVEFRCEDVRSAQPPGPFRLILCRNLVFTYFDDALQRRVLGEMLKRLAIGGVLVTGKQEPLPETSRLVASAPRTGVYRHRPP
jgi:chemotaxis protein methyltransferase CheR